MSRPFQFSRLIFPSSHYVEDFAAQPHWIQAVSWRLTIYLHCIANKTIAALEQLTRCEPFSDC